MRLISILNQCYHFPGFVYVVARLDKSSKSVTAVPPEREEVAVAVIEDVAGLAGRVNEETPREVAEVHVERHRSRGRAGESGSAEARVVVLPPSTTLAVAMNSMPAPSDQP